MNEIDASRLDAIRHRMDVATAGPWSTHNDQHPYRGSYTEVSPLTGSRTVCEITDQHEGNATFIAHAREDVPDLVAHIDAQAETIQALRGNVR